MINLGKTVDPSNGDNTVASRDGDISEAVTTMAELLSKNEAGRLGESPFVAPGSPKIAD